MSYAFINDCNIITITRHGYEHISTLDDDSGTLLIKPQHCQILRTNYKLYIRRCKSLFISILRKGWLRNISRIEIDSSKIVEIPRGVFIFGNLDIEYYGALVSLFNVYLLIIPYRSARLKYSKYIWDCRMPKYDNKIKMWYKIKQI